MSTAGGAHGSRCCLHLGEQVRFVEVKVRAGVRVPIRAASLAVADERGRALLVALALGVLADGRARPDLARLHRAQDSADCLEVLSS